MVNLYPADGRLIVKSVKKEDVSKGGIYMPSSEQHEDVSSGQILSLGRNLNGEQGRVVNNDLKVGDVVYFQKFNAQVVEIDREKYYILRYLDILAWMNNQ